MRERRCVPQEKFRNGPLLATEDRNFSVPRFLFTDAGNFHVADLDSAYGISYGESFEKSKAGIAVFIFFSVTDAMVKVYRINHEHDKFL
ncbi:hypothetical protein HW115_06475 [Verrucomicrobiaceae bacterium N1E253]|uniref:Uncharacterized protein n=1 Tax=Oceaniferula marina TaxID=2748318 RepID=A0A851GBY5_9BACT|nr:hypothetical protein [Oceaniferula marina]NWK55248.1 hypothetical protein [Oceaniferula marina]